MGICLAHSISPSNLQYRKSESLATRQVFLVFILLARQTMQDFDKKLFVASVRLLELLITLQRNFAVVLHRLALWVP